MQDNNEIIILIEETYMSSYDNCINYLENENRKYEKRKIGEVELEGNHNYRILFADVFYTAGETHTLDFLTISEKLVDIKLRNPGNVELIEINSLKNDRKLFSEFFYENDFDSLNISIDLNTAIKVFLSLGVNMRLNDSIDELIVSSNLYTDNRNLFSQSELLSCVTERNDTLRKFRNLSEKKSVELDEKLRETTLLRQQVTTLIADIETEHVGLKQSKERLADETRKNTDLDRKCSKFTLEVKELNNVKSLLESKLNNSILELEQSHRAGLDLKKRLDDLLTVVDGKNRSMKKLEEELASLTSENKELNSKSEKFQRMNSGLLEELEVSCNKNIELRNAKNEITSIFNENLKLLSQAFEQQLNAKDEEVNKTVKLKSDEFEKTLRRNREDENKKLQELEERHLFALMTKSEELETQKQKNRLNIEKLIRSERENKKQASKISKLENEVSYLSELIVEFNESKRLDTESTLGRRLSRIAKKAIGKSKAKSYTNEDVNIVLRSGLFDYLWYLKKYPDINPKKVNALDHFLKFSAQEKRDPGPNFSTRWYLKKYPDVQKSGMNPLLHYLRFGKSEGRSVRSDLLVNQMKDKKQ